MAEKLTKEVAQELLSYCPETGIFRWKERRGGMVPGAIAGCLFKDNRGVERVKISIKNRRYLAHRIAFLLMEGEFPEQLVDHKDCNPANNRWTNLRHASQIENKHNTRKRSNNTSGKKGVSFDKLTEKWGGKDSRTEWEI